MLDFLRLGKPTDNAFNESFNGSARGECLLAYEPAGCTIQMRGVANGLKRRSSTQRDRPESAGRVGQRLPAAFLVLMQMRRDFHRPGIRHRRQVIQSLGASATINALTFNRTSRTGRSWE